MAAEQIRDDVNGFGSAVIDFLRGRDMDVAALCERLAEAGHPISEETIRRNMTGEEWVDARLPARLVEVLDLDLGEQGRLARVVAYEQAAPKESSSAGERR